MILTFAIKFGESPYIFIYYINHQYECDKDVKNTFKQLRDEYISNMTFL